MSGAMSGTGAWRRERWRRIQSVAQRDLLEFVRDRRTLFVTLLMPMAMYPVLALASTLGLRTALIDIDARAAPRPVALALTGPDATDFAARFEAAVNALAGERENWPAGVHLELTTRDEAQRLLDNDDVDAWINVPGGTVAGLEGSGTVPIEARLSALRPADLHQQRHVIALLEAVAEQTRGQRLATAGLPESFVEPIDLKFVGAADRDEAAAMEGVVPTAAGGVLVLLALLTATGAFYPAIDAIAGEKERGTIETLLIAPAGLGDIVTGKFLAVWAVALATLVVNALSIGLTAVVLLRFLPNGFSLGVGPAAAGFAAAVTLLAFVGLAAVAAATCLAVTSASRSTKEAQNTLTPVILLVSGLAGSALLPGAGGRLLPLVPFAGQVAVARAAIPGSGAAEPAIALPLVLSLVSAAAITWLLLRAAAAALGDEEVLFRGPDSAAGLFSRPARRRRPTVMQGFAAALLAFAALWYAQGAAPESLAWAIPLQQAAVMLPLAVAATWQRVDRRATFGLRLPIARRPWVPLLGGLLLGAGLFLVGAAATLAIRGTHVSPAARDLAERIIALVLAQPIGLVWLLVAVLPAVCEELFFRGWLLSACAGDRPGRGRLLAAILLQAAVFAGFHLLPERMPQTFLLGIALGWMTRSTGSLLPAMLAHLAHNGTPLVLFWLVAGREARRLAAGDTSVLPWELVAGGVVSLFVGAWLIAASGNGLSRRRA
jgi:sodium transport system permease protein